jgi:hypothetical protein
MNSHGPLYQAFVNTTKLVGEVTSSDRCGLLWASRPCIRQCLQACRSGDSGSGLAKVGMAYN